MFRRGLTVVAWLVGLAAVTYEDVVAPIAHAAFGARVTQERVHGQEPGEVQNDSFAAGLAPALKDEPNWKMDVNVELPEAWARELDLAEAEAARTAAAHVAAARVMVAQALATRAAHSECDGLAGTLAKAFDGWL